MAQGRWVRRCFEECHRDRRVWKEDNTTLERMQSIPKDIKNATKTCDTFAILFDKRCTYEKTFIKIMNSFLKQTKQILASNVMRYIYLFSDLHENLILLMFFTIFVNYENLSWNEWNCAWKNKNKGSNKNYLKNNNTKTIKKKIFKN